jgi:DNA-binding GntR family transcriptional regulator
MCTECCATLVNRWGAWLSPGGERARGYDQVVDLASDDARLEYVKIANELRDDILSGRLQPGDKLPTARQLMKRHGVATHTVTSALRVLQSEGLTYSVHGRGTYVRDDLDVENRRTAQQVQTGDVGQTLAELTHAVSRIESQLRQLVDEMATLRKSIDNRD